MAFTDLGSSLGAQVGAQTGATIGAAIPTSNTAVTPAQGSVSGVAGALGQGVGQDISTGVNAGVNGQKPSAYAWLLAWGVLLATLALLDRTRLGHAAIYYGLLLMLFFVLVSNYRFVATALAPFDTLPK